MALMFGAWAVSAAGIILLAIWLGQKTRHDSLGVLIDTRGRFSLTQLQILLWTTVVLSLISGTFFARFLGGVPGALDFKIPDELLLVMGISVGSTVTAAAVKSGKDTVRPGFIAASNSSDKPHFRQIFLVEEGEFADRVVDVTKFQNFLITLVLIVAYVALGVATIQTAGTPASLVALPGFAGTFVTLLGVSHAGYLAGKIPDKPGTPAGLTVLRRTENWVAVPPGGVVPAGVAAAMTYQPRNP